jgi:hypothetical protein
MYPIPASQRLATLSVAALLLASASGPALALDGDAFIAKVNEAYASFNGKLEFDSIVTEDDTVTVGGARFVSPGQPPFSFGELQFEGVEETGDGGYTVETVLVPDIDYTQDDVRLTLVDMSMSGLVVPAKFEPGSIDSLLFYESFTAGPLTVSVKGKEMFSLESLDGEVTRRDGDTGMDIVMSGDGIAINLADVEDEKAREAFRKLGYDKLDGSIKFDMGWDLTGGRLELREYSFDFDDVGKFDIRLDISGYTIEFLKAMQEAQVAAAANPDPQAGANALNFAMLGLVQQLSFNSASIRFDDDSLTSRALEFAGSEQGVSGKQMADALKGMLPLMLGQLNIPALQQQISAAAGTFLDNPKSITITAKPANPVPVPMLMGAAQDPRQMAEILNVQVTAND